MPHTNEPVILFDGPCVLCQRSVRWILERDRRAVFRFAALQSAVGRALVDRAAAAERALPDSVVLCDEQGLHTESEAVVRILARLSAPWRWLSLARVLPRALRDAAYRAIARRRRRWFGNTDVCPVMPSEWRSRFLDSAD